MAVHIWASCVTGLTLLNVDLADHSYRIRWRLAKARLNVRPYNGPTCNNVGVVISINAADTLTHVHEGRGLKRGAHFERLHFNKRRALSDDPIYGGPIP